MKNNKKLSTRHATPLAQTALDSTVLLVMKDNDGQTLGRGSGFFVHDGSLIATNLHVVHGASECLAKLVGEKKMYDIEGYVAVDPENDLAILKIGDVDEPGVPLSLGDSDSVHIGETVYAVGTPRGYEGTVSNGIISGIRIADKLIQMTAPISPGSSGGPVINNRGEVVGVSVGIRQDGQNLNFAIPSNYLETLIPKAERALPKPLLLAKLEGVVWVNEELLWEKPADLPYRYYQFNLLNQRREPIKEIKCLVIFRDAEGKLIHSDLVRVSEEILPGEHRTIMRANIFNFSIEKGEIGSTGIDYLTVTAALISSSSRWSFDDFSLVPPETKRLTKTYEVRVVDFEVVD